MKQRQVQLTQVWTSSKKRKRALKRQPGEISSPSRYSKNFAGKKLRKGIFEYAIVGPHEWACSHTDFHLVLLMLKHPRPLSLTMSFNLPTDPPVNNAWIRERNVRDEFPRFFWFWIIKKRKDDDFSTALATPMSPIHCIYPIRLIRIPPNKKS